MNVTDVKQCTILLPYQGVICPSVLLRTAGELTLHTTREDATSFIFSGMRTEFFFSENLKEGDYKEDLGVDRKVE
jgi:hypothetical protein